MRMFYLTTYFRFRGYLVSKRKLRNKICHYVQHLTPLHHWPFTIYPHIHLTNRYDCSNFIKLSSLLPNKIQNEILTLINSLNVIQGGAD